MIISPENHHFENPRGFIVVEGVNGAGKSTVLAAIDNHLKAKGLTVNKTFEPGDTSLGKELRKLLLNSPHVPRNSTAELLLFGADRSEHIDSCILPSLKRGEIILCDRFLYSTIAFQGYGRGLDRKVIDQVNQIAVRDHLPDLVILLDLDAETGLSRTRARNTQDISQQDSFEREAIEFHTRIRDGFLELAKFRPEPFVVVDATQAIEAVQKQVLIACDSVINSLLSKRERD